MKKLLIGCAILCALFVVGAAAVSYFVYHKVSTTVAGFAELGKVPELERSVRNQTAYRPPSSGEPSQAQLDRLLAVQGAVRERLGARAEEMQHKYHALLAKDSAGVTDVPALVSAYRDLAVAYVDAKKAQVDALNRAGLSLEEYRWVRNQAYAAIGMPMVDYDVGQMVQDVKNGRTPTQPLYRFPLGATGSPATQKLIAPHQKALEANAGLAFFGL